MKNKIVDFVIKEYLPNYSRELAEQAQSPEDAGAKLGKRLAKQFEKALRKCRRTGLVSTQQPLVALTATSALPIELPVQKRSGVDSNHRTTAH